MSRGRWYAFGIGRRSSVDLGWDARQSEARDDLVLLVRLDPTAWEANLGGTCRERGRDEERVLRCLVDWSPRLG